MMHGHEKSDPATVAKKAPIRGVASRLQQLGYEISARP